MLNEIWVPVPFYEGIYEASSEGRIRSAEGKITTRRDGLCRVWKSRILKGRGSNPKTGYRVNLFKNGVHKDFLVARIITMSFLGVPQETMTVNHKDGDRFNNRICNLEWLSLEENIRHGFDNGLYDSVTKSIKISNEGNVFSFESMSSASKFLGRNKGYVSNCKNRGKNPICKEGNEYVFIE